MHTARTMGGVPTRDRGGRHEFCGAGRTLVAMDLPGPGSLVGPAPRVSSGLEFVWRRVALGLLRTVGLPRGKEAAGTTNHAIMEAVWVVQIHPATGALAAPAGRGGAKMGREGGKPRGRQREGGKPRWLRGSKESAGRVNRVSAPPRGLRGRRGLLPIGVPSSLSRALSFQALPFGTRLCARGLSPAVLGNTHNRPLTRELVTESLL